MKHCLPFNYLIWVIGGLINSPVDKISELLMQSISGVLKADSLEGMGRHWYLGISMCHGNFFVVANEYRRSFSRCILENAIEIDEVDRSRL